MRIPIAFWLLVMSAAVPPALLFGTEPEGLRLNSSITLASGQLNTGIRQTLAYFPLSFGYVAKRGSLMLTSPYIFIDTTGETTFVNGRFQRVRKMRKSDFSGNGTVSNSGQGDLLLEGRYLILGQPIFQKTSLELLASVKIPTADDAKAMGTGKLDGGGGFELDYRFNEKDCGLVGWNYMVIGSPADTLLRNQITYRLGWKHQITPSLEGRLSYREDTSLLEGEPNPRSILLACVFQLIPAIQLNGGAEAGLNSGAPDYNFTVGFSLRPQ